MKKLFEVIFNLVFWIIITYLFYSYYTTRFGWSFDENFGKFHIPHLTYVLFFTLIGPIVIFYLFYLVLIPKFLVRKRYLLFIVFGLLSSILVGYSFRMVVGGFVDNPIKNLVFYTTMALIWGITGSATKGFSLWFDSINERMTLRKKQLESKNALLLLQAQINPHFLFNSLNNIDILIEDAPKAASEYLKKLSDILRYVLYETKEDKTDLSKEIDQIKSYIDLQKIRSSNPHYVNFKIVGKIGDHKIAPMIFIPFIENAFKHTKDKTINNAIDIEFEIQDQTVKMTCKNYYESTQLEIIKNEGLGNETIKQRLNLLYPKKHKLIIDKTDNWFNVILSIDFNNVN